MGKRKTYDGVIERVPEPAFSKKATCSFSCKTKPEEVFSTNY
jgi:hypothetical protein